MSETLSQKHLDLLNLIAASPPPIDSSQMVTKFRRPSLEDILSSPTTAAKTSNRVSMSGIYLRSRPTSFSELEMAFDPDYDYEELLAQPISPTAVKETLASLGLRLQQGHSLFMQLSQIQGQFQQDESSTSGGTVVVPAVVRPPKPTRPLPSPEGPPPGYVTVISSVDEYDSDGEEIVYMLDEYNSNHQCIVGDAKDQGLAPDLPLPALPTSSTAPTEEQPLLQAVAIKKPQDTEVTVDNAPSTFKELQKSDYLTSRAQKRMGLVGIQVTPIEIDAPTVETPIVEAEANPKPATRMRTSSKTVTFAPDTVIRREPKISLSRVRSLKAGEGEASIGTTASQVSQDDETPCTLSSASDSQDQLTTPAVEVSTVDFAELEKANTLSTVEGTLGKKAKKHHFGVYKIIRNVLKRNSGEQKAGKSSTTTIVEEPSRSKTPTPSITTTVGGRPNVLRKPDPAAKVRSSAASVYSVNVAAETGSQKTKKPFRAWSIRSGKGGRKGATDPAQFPSKESATNVGPLAPPTTRRVGILRRSASFSGFATITTPGWDDPVGMEQLLKDAAERLKQNPQREWVYKPDVAPILEQGENPIDVGFVLERHVAAA